MTLLDAGTIIIVMLFLARGIWTGFVRQIASIAALIIGFVVAGRYYGESAYLVIPFIADKETGFFIAYIVLFVLSFFTVILLGLLLKKVMVLSLLGWFDRFLGGLLGLAKGAFVVCLLFMGLTLVVSDASPLLRQSCLYPYLESGSRLMLSVIRNPELRDALLPRKPAISSFVDSTVDLGKKITGQAE
jgi:membrane protein required for colicin V production